MWNKDYVTVHEQERRRKAGVNETKAARTINLPITYWALIDQIKSKLDKKNTNQTIMYCIHEIAISEGLES
jgi:hypothetical protein